MQQLFSKSSDWIWMDNAPDVNCYVEFFDTFETVSSEKIELLISVEGQYAAFLNGQYLPSTQYPDYPFYKAVQKVVLKNASTNLRNELVIQTLYCGVDSHTTRRETPGLRFEVWQGGKLLCTSGKLTRARMMSCYQSGPMKNITPQLGAGFVYKKHRENEWNNSVVVNKECMFVSRPVNELVLGDEQNAQLVTHGIFTAHDSGLQQYASLAFRETSALIEELPQPTNGNAIYFPSDQGLRISSSEGDGIYLVMDMGLETTGYLDLDIVCPEATRVDIGFGEHLEDMRVRTDVGGRHFTFQWEATAERCRFTHYFHRVGARYLQLFIYGHEAIVYSAGIRPLNYPFSEESAFHCSDHLHNQIYETAKHTLRCCVHQHYEDSPWREQSLYAFDSRSQMLFGYYAFGEMEQPKASLKLLALSQREDGLLELCAPGRVSVTIPSFSLMFIVALEEYCRYSGDVAFGKELLPTAQKILDAVQNHVRDGLVWNFQESCYWNFYEWTPLLDAEPIFREETLSLSAEAPLQLLYILAMQRMCKIHTYLDIETDEIEEKIRVLQKGMEQFWNLEAGAYASFIRNQQQVQYSELVQALALCTGIVPIERQKALRERIYKGKLVHASLATSIFVYEALLQEPETYGTSVFDEVAERWGKMLYNGATTFWETDNGAEDFERAGSLCHAWSCIPIYLYGAYALGIKPIAPGVWEQTDTVPCGIHNVEGRFCTPSGIIEVHGN